MSLVVDYLDDEDSEFVGRIVKVENRLNRKYWKFEIHIEIQPLDKPGWKMQHIWVLRYNAYKVRGSTAIGDIMLQLETFGIFGTSVLRTLETCNGRVFVWRRKRIGRMQRKIWFPVELVA